VSRIGLDTMDRAVYNTNLWLLFCKRSQGSTEQDRRHVVPIVTTCGGWSMASRPPRQSPRQIDCAGVHPRMQSSRKEHRRNES
jgi:hypothetical protein